MAPLNSIVEDTMCRRSETYGTSALAAEFEIEILIT